MHSCACAWALVPIRQAKLHTMAQNLTCCWLFGSIEPHSAAESVGLSSQMHELTQFVSKFHVVLAPVRPNRAGFGTNSK